MPDGDFLFSTGNAETDPGEFNEPASIAILPNADIAELLIGRFIISRTSG